MIFDARKSAQNSKQAREATVATSRLSASKLCSPDSNGAAPDAFGFEPQIDEQTRTAEVQRANPTHTDTFSTAGLGLRVERQADYWRVTWNRNASVGPMRGRLSLIDGIVHEELELRTKELQTGIVTYSYSPTTDDVVLRLEISGSESPSPISESVRLAADSAPSPLARMRRSTLLQRHRKTARVARPRPAKAHEVSQDIVAQDFASVRSLLRKPRSEPVTAIHESGPQQGSTFEPAKLIAGSSPIYPATAQHSFASESVEVSFRISPEGKVYNTKWVKGSPILAQAATEAVESWLYEPARLNGAPIDSQGTATIDFKQAEADALSFLEGNP
jgi:protein TonB